VRLTPDGRDLLYELSVKDSYVDMEMDRSTGTLWLADETSNEVVRRAPGGGIVGASIDVGTPGDVSVSSNRGIGWVVSISSGQVLAYGPDLNDPAPQRSIGTSWTRASWRRERPTPRSGSGTKAATLYRFRAVDLVQTHVWALGAGPSAPSRSTKRPAAPTWRRAGPWAISTI